MDQSANNQLPDHSKQVENKYDVTGIKTSLHGIDYQIKLLMLFAKRGLDQGYTFTLETEVDAADKFDDLVFKYDNEDKSGKVYRFLQAKHKQDESKKITLDDLLKEEKGNFSLRKYFISYRKILNSSKFKDENVTFKDFIICTNIDIDDKLQKMFKLIDTDDYILGHPHLDKSKRLKIVPTNFAPEQDIIGILKSTTDFARLASKIAKIVSNKKQSFTKDELLKSYSGWLFSNVLCKFKEESKLYAKFNDDFLNPKSKHMENFQKATITAYLEECRNKPENNTALERFIEAKIEIPKAFKIDESDDDLPNDVTEDEIEGFLDKLVLAVNQPNEIELDNIILSEICEGMDSIIKELTASRFHKYMLDWVKAKEGVSLSTEDIKTFFTDLQRKIASIAQKTLTSTYVKDIEDINYVFQNKEYIIQEIKSFLTHSHQILTVYQKNLFLSKKKIFQAIQNAKQDEYIFQDFKTFELHVDKVVCPIKVFNLKTCKLLVIDIHSEYFVSDIKKTKEKIKRILKILYLDRTKQVIFIIHQEKQDSAEKLFKDIFCELNMKTNEKYMKLIDIKLELEDFTPESQNKLMNEDKVLFQGKLTSIEKLVGKKVDNWNLIFPMTSNSSDIMQHEIISKIISGDTIKIGKSPCDINYNHSKHNYIERTFYRHIKIKEDIKKIENTFYVTYNTEISKKLSNLCDVVVVSDKEDDFVKLCIQNPDKAIHWLKVTNGELIWQQSQGTLSRLHKYVCESSEILDAYMLQSKNLSDRIAVIAAEPGMGKSTVLTHLAMCMKETPDFNNQWILKVNLKYHSKYFEELKDKRKAIDIKEAIKFLYTALEFEFQDNEIKTNEINKMISIDNNGDISLKLHRDISINQVNLLKFQVFNYMYNHGKVVLLLDGFDEICPYYKNRVLSILEILKNSKLQKVWATTRLYNIQRELENCLSTFSYAIIPLREEDKWSLLKNYLKTKLISKINDDKVSKFITKFKEKNHIFNHKMSTFMSIPLHVWMIASVLEDKCTEFCNAENESILDLTISLYTLYEAFFRIKFDKILFGHIDTAIPENKTFHNKNRRDSIRQHGVLALFELFTKDELESFLPKRQIREGRNLIQTVMLGNEKTGLINRVVDGKPHFVHRTYAEYFAAVILADMLIDTKKRESTRKFLYHIFINCEYNASMIFDFINFKLVAELDDAEIFNAALTGNLEKITEHEKVDQICDAFGRTPLHLLCTSETEINVALLLLIINLSNSDLLTDRLFEWTPLHYLVACHKKCPNQEQYDILKYYLENRITDVEKMVTQDMAGKTPIILAVQLKRKTLSFYWLHNYFDKYALVKDNANKLALDYALDSFDWFVDFRNYSLFDVLFRYSNGEQCKLYLQQLFEGGPFDFFHGVLFKLVEYEHQNDIRDWVGSIFNINQNFTVQLLSYYPQLFPENIDVNIYDSYFCTAIQYASRKNMTSVLVLLRMKADPNLNRGGDTAINNAIQNCNSSMIKLLIEMGSYIDISKTGDLYDRIQLFRHLDFCAFENNYLRDYPVSLNLKDKIIVNARSADDGKTVLHHAAQKGDLRAVMYLLANGAFYNVPDKNYDTPLHLCSKYEDVVHFLNHLNETFDAAATKDINEVTRGDLKWLNTLSLKDEINISDLCTKAFINSRDYNRAGMTLLHLAIQNGHLGLVKTILKQEGLKLGSVTIELANVLHIALENFRLEILGSLLSYISEKDLRELIGGWDLNEESPLDLEDKTEAISMVLTKICSFESATRNLSIFRIASDIATRLNFKDLSQQVDFKITEIVSTGQLEYLNLMFEFGSKAWMMTQLMGSRCQILRKCFFLDYTMLSCCGVEPWGLTIQSNVYIFYNFDLYLRALPLYVRKNNEGAYSAVRSLNLKRSKLDKFSIGFCVPRAQDPKTYWFLRVSDISN